MKGVLFRGDRNAVVKEFPDPRPGMGEALVRVVASSICGSDMHAYRKSAAELGNRAGLIQGHEACGVVEAIGGGVQGVNVGDRVLVDMSMGCGRCEYCLQGEDRYCASARSLGMRWHGSMADYVLANARSCVPLPDAMSFVDGAVCACAGGTAFRATKNLRVSGADTVALFGLGPVGLVGLLVAKALGAKVIGIEMSPERRAKAEDLGADLVLDPSTSDPVDKVMSLTSGKGADVAIDYSGSGVAQAQSLECVRLYGRVSWVGVNEGTVTVEPLTIIMKQISLQGSLTYGLADIPALFRFVMERHLPLEAVVTHRMSLDQAPEALRLFDTGTTGKIAFV